MSTTAALPQTIQAIEDRIGALRNQLADHPLYGSIRTVEHVRLFMESHVFAVWDFMCLLKCLQRSLTSVGTFWVPTRYAESRRFINEIVLGEESDVCEGRAASHFEIYLEAMAGVGADAAVIASVIEAIQQGASGQEERVEEALAAAPAAARQFVGNTLRVIREGTVAAQAAAFTFGREDAIPDMFRALVRELNEEAGGELSRFVWYLERHIEVDGEDHGPLSLRMVADLCGDDALLWEDAGQAAETALRARVALWDGILEQIQGAAAR